MIQFFFFSITVQARPRNSLYGTCTRRCRKQPCHNRRNSSEKRNVFGVVKRELLGTW